jgi:C-terminal processing protease CtpA/Prc
MLDEGLLVVRLLTFSIHGASLEGQGVTPDEIVIPSAEDLQAGRDPALARAAAILGIKLSSLHAGLLFGKREPPPAKDAR